MSDIALSKSLFVLVPMPYAQRVMDSSLYSVFASS